MRVMKCSEKSCHNPATWKHGTWWACDEHIKSWLCEPEMFDKGHGMSGFGTAFRLQEYEPASDTLSDFWLELVTVEIEEDA